MSAHLHGGSRARVAVIIAALGSCLVGAMSCTHGLVPAAAPLRSADTIVVLGNRPPTDADGNVMPETRRRVTRGVELFRAGLANEMLMTGGPAPHDRVESEVMRDLAVELGVPREAIRVETRSTDTIENARFGVALLCEGEAFCHPSVIVVSSPYHLQRARRLFECAGARVQTAASEDPGGDYGRRFAFSERFVGLAYAFIDECAQARDEPRP